MTPNDLNVKETLYQIDLLLHNAARRRFVRIVDCDDLRQDVFIAVFTGTERYDAGRSSWPTFLATIIQSEIHRLRLKKRCMKHSPCGNIHDLEEEDHPLTNVYPSSELNDVERIVFRGEIRQAVGELPGELQTICRLLFTSSKVQAADLLGMEPKLLSQKISRIRRLLMESNIIRDYL
jgi:RNA polymerase sigma factor (sigma-70 family)